MDFEKSWRIVRKQNVTTTVPETDVRTDGRVFTVSQHNVSVREDSNGRGEDSNVGGCCFCVVMAGAVCTVITLTLLAIAISLLGIAKLVIGVMYYKDCDLQPLLPIFLLVDASTAILYSCCNCGDTNSDDKLSRGVAMCTTVIKTIIGLFHLAWLVCGTLWVLHVRDVIYSPDYCGSLVTTTPATPSSTESSIFLSTLTSVTPSAGPQCLTCSEMLADFTFAVVIFQWVLAGFVLFTLFITLSGTAMALCVACCCKRE